MLALYDRKTPRHWWNLYCKDDNLDRLAWLSAQAERKMKDKTGWERYQTSITTIDFDYGDMAGCPCSQPQNALAALQR